MGWGQDDKLPSFNTASCIPGNASAVPRQTMTGGHPGRMCRGRMEPGIWTENKSNQSSIRINIHWQKI